MILLGLTGSIGMGKTTTAALFAEAGAAVYDADAAVHELYAAGGAAVEPVARSFPGVAPQGRVDRTRLSEVVRSDPEALRRLETIVHPLVVQHRRGFLGAARCAGARVAVLDVPLLFETNGQTSVHAVVVVTAPEPLQRSRVLERPGMDADKLALLLARQLPDAVKRARADFLIHTDRGIEAARDQVLGVLQTVTRPGWRPRVAPRLESGLDLDGPGEPPH